MAIHGVICVTGFTPWRLDRKPECFCALKPWLALPPVPSLLFLSTNNPVVFTGAIRQPPTNHHNLYNKDNVRTRSLELSHEDVDQR